MQYLILYIILAVCVGYVVMKIKRMLTSNDSHCHSCGCSCDKKSVKS